MPGSLSGQSRRKSSHALTTMSSTSLTSAIQAKEFRGRQVGADSQKRSRRKVSEVQGSMGLARLSRSTERCSADRQSDLYTSWTSASLSKRCLDWFVYWGNLRTRPRCGLPTTPRRRKALVSCGQIAKAGVRDERRWNRLDAAMKAMGLCPARADRCTYVSYDESRKSHMAHVSDACEATPSIGESMPSLDEDSYFKVHDDILNQLMEAYENKQLKVWSPEVERRDVYLTAKKTSPSWEKVILRKTVDFENDKDQVHR